MTERTTGARAALSKPGIYNLFQRALGEGSARARFVAEHLRPQPGERFLDIGCGPGKLAALLPEVRYFGVDVNPAYIEAARREYGNRAEFEVLDATRAGNAIPKDRFDAAVVSGVVHHLDDDQAASLFEMASRALVSSGRLVVLENTYVNGQNPFARWLISRDRGANVREPEAYLALAEGSFEEVLYVVREDLLRVPYTHVILECSGPRPRSPGLAAPR